MKNKREKKALTNMTKQMLKTEDGQKTAGKQSQQMLEKPTKKAVAKRLGISRSMLYYQHKRPNIDEEIKKQIEAVMVKHQAYGHKRIAIELKLNKKSILRIMKKYNLKPYRRRVKKPRKKEDEGKEAEKGNVNVYKFLCPIHINIVWVSDFTYIKYKGRFIYVATIMDMFTREIVGIAISRYHNRNLIMEAYMNAEQKTETHAHYQHSDQGSEYTSEEYKTYVTSHGVTMSFADKGSPWQNGFQESFYGKFKVDLGDVNRFETLGELIEAIYNQIYYYNNERIHSAHKTSPITFKLAFLKSREKVSEKLGT
jgi:transposase InsO family protein